MRQIEFRAWDKINKKMYHTKLFETWWYTFADKDETGHSRASIPKDSEQEQRSRLEVMQFTGLKDKNNKEIYEGDIIKINDDYEEVGWMAGEIREVYFKDSGFRIKPNRDTIYPNLKQRGHWIDSGEDLEIIGNIYENPEVLK